LSESIDDVATANVQDDGTLTFTLRDAWLCNRVFQFASQRNGTPWVANSGSIHRVPNLFLFLTCINVATTIGGESGSPLRVLVDYASPNMAKELHVGHVRSAIIGHAIGNTLELLGHDVQRVSHVGDFGTPIALVVARALSRWCANDPPPACVVSSPYCTVVVAHSACRGRCWSPTPRRPVWPRSPNCTATPSPPPIGDDFRLARASHHCRYSGVGCGCGGRRVAGWRVARRLRGVARLVCAHFFAAECESGRARRVVLCADAARQL
jgi:hypothetical protein